jgi:histidinol-phosphate aminotransferase
MTTYLSKVRSEVRTLAPYNSGLTGESVRARYNVAHVAKLGSNENPWGTSPKVLAALAEAVAESALYPDPASNLVREALAERLGVAPQRIALGNGSEDLISVCSHTFLSPGDEMVTIAPAFGLHVLFPTALGAPVRAVRVEANYRLDIEKLIAAITPQTRMIMFSSPSNPLGTSISGDDLRRLLNALPSETLLIFDEAYHEYAAASPEYPDFLGILAGSDASWILLRTFSKAYGLAGLRVGYGVASDEALIDLINRTRTPFNVNRIAQVGALAALADQEFVRTSVARTIDERKRLCAALTEMGYSPAPSIANFLFFNAREDASALAARLLPHGVIVKPWKEEGYLEHIRVSVGPPEANQQFLTALAATAQPMKETRD